MCSAMNKLCTMLKIRSNSPRVVTDLHVRCIAHVVSLESGDCLKEVPGIDKTRSLLAAMHSSVKRSDIFESTLRQIRVTVHYHCPD